MLPTPPVQRGLTPYHTGKDPIPKEGHICKFRVNMNLGGGGGTLFDAVHTVNSSPGRRLSSEMGRALANMSFKARSWEPRWAPQRALDPNCNVNRHTSPFPRNTGRCASEQESLAE